MAKKNSQLAIQPAERIPKHIKKLLKKDKAGYVLITCDLPTPDGNMEVEMTHEGDIYLVSYLLDMAQAIVEQKLA